ncbi:uncharacterized protein LOC125662607 isoform X2 [Ostrea edulis]|uniref:uncharacterized protein LOC125662607 isoform X2 n=1 Tax=Ostrea edulis TaxID=37623 RepID=UPI0024AEF59D|nr:uncharacterized protein LOC125662607 isoform X2 [Ostrea edulis]
MVIKTFPRNVCVLVVKTRLFDKHQLYDMRRRKKSVTINFFSNMSEISEETEELLLAEERLSARSSTSNCSKEAEKDTQKSEESKPESDTAESELSDDDSVSSTGTGKRKYTEKDVIEESSANPLIDKPEEINDPLVGMEMDQFNNFPSDPCPAPCDGSSSTNQYEILINCTVASDQLGLSGRYFMEVHPLSLDLVECDTMKKVHSWKYGHIQRFGYNKSTNDFLMVTGRRSKLGNGVFDFHVKGDPRKIIDSLQNKPGCSLRLADSSKRISNMI